MFWYENSRRDLGRDWHRVLDPQLSFKWDEQAYWHQYEWDFPQHVFKWYVEETSYVGPFALTGGVKQFMIEVSREDQFHVNQARGVDSDSDLLFSGGVTYETPVKGLDLFAGYADNFKAIGSTLLEVPGRSLKRLEPETASNIDVGLQYAGEAVALSAAWYSIDFQNRIFYLGPQTPTGPDYLVPGCGAYFNAGGIGTSGIELAATVARVLDCGQQPARRGLPVRHHRECGLAGSAEDDFDDRDRLVLTEHGDSLRDFR